MKVYDILKKLIAILFLVLFLPILFSIVFVDKGVNYPEYYKLTTYLPNVLLFLIGAVLILVLVLFGRRLNKTEINKKNSLIVNSILFVCFVVLAIVNIKISKCIQFQSAWADPLNVSYAARRSLEGHSIDEDTFYYTLAVNNVPIVYFISRLLKVFDVLKSFPYSEHFFLIEVNCIIISAVGFAGSVILEKVSRKFTPLLVFVPTYGVLAALSPWKVFFYTDMAGFFFPVLALLMYVLYLQKESWFRYICWGLFVVFGIFSGLVKPTAFIPLIAVTMVELLRTVCLDSKKLIKSGILLGILVCFAVLLLGPYKKHMYSELQYTYNKDLAQTWTNFLNMGANGEYMGTCNGEDSGMMIGKYQDQPGEVRHKAELQSFANRIKERGFWGNISFYHRKLVMTFNDGTFSWFKEGIANFFSGFGEDISASRLKPFLWSYYWEFGENFLLFTTIHQLFWIMVLTLVPFGTLRLLKKNGNEHNFVFAVVVSVIGVILFQMLFETRARYLICSLPVIIFAASFGFEMICSFKINSKDNKEACDGKASC